MAAVRSGLRAGAGQSTTIATRLAAAASPQPMRRSGISLAGAGIATGRMNASSSEVVAPASTELMAPENSTAKPTTAIAMAASAVERDTSVPRQTAAAPATASVSCDSTRSRIVPGKSTSVSCANVPKAANVARAGLAITLSPMANSAGITSAVRVARRVAA